jgi:putative addiction module killer protein
MGTTRSLKAVVDGRPHGQNHTILKDETLRGVIAARIKRLEFGLMGDVRPVGDGISELRIHMGPGWRLYFTQRGPHILVLLVGGSKRSQQKDIQRAKVLAARLD